jgi:hypothetical protein
MYPTGHSGTWQSAPGRTRTCDHKIRSHVLYPAELRGQKAPSPGQCSQLTKWLQTTRNAVRNAVGDTSEWATVRPATHVRAQCGRRVLNDEEWQRA